jgi:hypothetical protein
MRSPNISTKQLLMKPRPTWVWSESNREEQAKTFMDVPMSVSVSVKFFSGNLEESSRETNASLTGAMPTSLSMRYLPLMDQLFLKTVVLSQNQGRRFSVQSISVGARYSAIAVIRGYHIPNPKRREKEKDPAGYSYRLGHLHSFLLMNKNGMGSWPPTLAAKTKTRRGWGTQQSDKSGSSCLCFF